MGSREKMASSATSITFELEKDPFVKEDSNKEKLDTKWFDLAKLLLGEDLNQREQKLSDFRDVISSDPKLSRFLTPNLLESEDYLTIYLRAGAWDVAQALKVLNSFYNLGLNYHPYVEMSIPSKLDHVWQEKLSSVCETRDKFGRRVVILKLGKWNPDTIPVTHWFASCFVLFELLTKEVKTQIAGLTLVLDVQGFTWKHLRNLGITELRLAAAFLTGSFPLWIRKIHVVHQPRIFGILLNLVSPFFSDSISVALHGSDLAPLHQEVSPRVLPQYLGGEDTSDN